MRTGRGAVIGVDYGTQSARAVLIDAQDGRTLAGASYPYPHGVMPGDVASAEDYETALYTLLERVCLPEYRDAVAGVCVDATSLTLVGVDDQGRALARIPEFKNREQAQIKLWKRHAAQKQADEALALAKAMNEPFLERTGGTLSSEWTLPKLLEMRDEDREVYDRMDRALDLCEYLTMLLSGKSTRSVASMSYKMLWSRDLGLPSDAFLNALRPGFAQEYRRLLRGEILCPGQAVGTLRPELADRLGLRRDVIVSAGALDGHTPAAALGALRDGDAALVVGTSNVLVVQSERLYPIQGVCGVAKDAMSPGLWAIEGGQNCTGDMLEWYMNNALPAEVYDEAKRRETSPHQVLAGRVERPWECAVTALDWWNGSRNAPCDLSRRGVMAGMTLNTKPENVYLALLQSIVCGTREIIQRCAEYGVKVSRVLATGGVVTKNPLLMDQYANLLNLPVLAGAAPEGPALGAAVYAAAAAGLYPDVCAAAEHMGVREFKQYLPDEAHRAAYEAIYRRSHALRELMRSWPET